MGPVDGPGEGRAIRFSAGDREQHAAGGGGAVAIQSARAREQGESPAPSSRQGRARGASPPARAAMPRRSGRQRRGKAHGSRRLAPPGGSSSRHDTPVATAHRWRDGAPERTTGGRPAPAAAVPPASASRREQHYASAFTRGGIRPSPNVEAVPQRRTFRLGTATGGLAEARKPDRSAAMLLVWCPRNSWMHRGRRCARPARHDD
jgi:hypothetical protein